MKQTLILVVLLVVSTVVNAQTATPPALGDGTSGSPYQIATLDNLYWLSQSDTAWDKYYIQTTDINAGDTKKWDIVGSDTLGFFPIGNAVRFSGTYNGKEHAIDSLFINRPSTNNIGFFGQTYGADIDSLGVTNVNITGYDYVGALVGYNNYYSTVNNSYSSGSVSSHGYVGGLIGRNVFYSSINNSYSTCFVSCTGYAAGGLVGYNDYHSTIVDTYSKGDVSSSLDLIGGLVGWNSKVSTINNSYCTGNVFGSIYVGGLVGKNSSDGQGASTINNSYCTGNVFGSDKVGGLAGGSERSNEMFSYSKSIVNGTSNVGGLVGIRYFGGSTLGSLWDVDVSGQTTSSGGIGKTTAEMHNLCTYLNVNWDFQVEDSNGTNDYWAMDSLTNNGYPTLSWQGEPHTAYCCAYASLTKDTIEVCDSFTVPSGDKTYSISGIYYDTIPNSCAADSILEIHLTVKFSNTGIDTQTTCDSLVWMDGNTYYANNNTATHTLTNVALCDSVVTLDLTVNYANTGTDVQTACDSLTWIDGNTYYANNNTATHTLTNAALCDSVVTLDLTVNYANTGTDVQTACDSLTWMDGNTYYANNNTATHTLTNAALCDSVVTLDLTVNYANTGTDVQTACDSLVWIDGNTYYANNNTATHTLTNAALCDSVVTLDLTVNYANTGTDVQTACDSLVWIDGNTYYATNNTATHTLTNAALCDSVVTLDLTVNYATSGSISPSACFTYISPSGNYTWDTTGTYIDTIPNTALCDSVITINLTINTVDVSVTVNSITLTATLSAASYQWVDCANSYAVIAGETNQSFTPTVNGDYAVIIDDGICVDTSLCYLITGVGINEDGINSVIVIYPNPTSGLITIEGEDIEVVKVFDVNGKRIYETVIANEVKQSPINTLNIDLSTYSKGIYLVNVKTNSGVVVRKVVLE